MEENSEGARIVPGTDAEPKRSDAKEDQSKPGSASGSASS
jgi:hypothetical protein